MLEMYLVRIASRLCWFSLHCKIRYSGLLRLGSPAYLACAAGDRAALRRLLVKGEVSITDATASGDTLLHVSHYPTPYDVEAKDEKVATQRNQKDMVTELVQLGVDVTATNDFGELVVLHRWSDHTADFYIP